MWHDIYWYISGNKIKHISLEDVEENSREIKIHLNRIEPSAERVSEKCKGECETAMKVHFYFVIK